MWKRKKAKIIIKVEEIIIKFIIILGLIVLMSLILTVIFSLIFKYNKDLTNKALYYEEITFGIVGVIYTICLFTFNPTSLETLAKKVKAIEKDINYDNFDEFIDAFFKESFKYGYRVVPLVTSGEYNERVICRNTNLYRNAKLEFVFFVKINKLNDDVGDKINDIIDKTVKSQFKDGKIRGLIGFTLVIDVHEVDDYARKFIDCNIEQASNKMHFFVMTDSKNKKIYLSRQEYGYGIDKYKYLKNEFMKIFNVINKEGD